MTNRLAAFILNFRASRRGLARQTPLDGSGRAFCRCFVLAFALLLTACGGLAGEPRIVATIAPLPSAPAEVSQPLTPPDMAQGAQIFAARCTDCHGQRGAGDGQLVRSGQVQNAGNFAVPDAAYDQTPLAWFTTITNGRIENLMPPWREALNEPERWSVALYTYTMHYTQAQLERGRAVWAESCAACHGDGGRGDGPQAAELETPPRDLTDQAQMVNLSDSALETSLIEAHPALPALSADDRRAAIAYTRALGVTNVNAIGQDGAPLQAAQVPPPQTTAEADQAAATVEPSGSATIVGQVTNGTAGGTVPETLRITLFAFSPEGERREFTTDSAADGSYRFENIPNSPEWRYIVTTAYRERVFVSPLITGTGDYEAIRALTIPTGSALQPDGSFALPVTIYELTEDAAVIEITRVVTQVSAVGDSLEIVQVMTLRNTSDRVYTSSNVTEDGRPISVVMPLPPGALVAGFGEQNRFVVAQDQFTVLDTLPVLPGEDHFIQMIYLVEYGGSAIIEQPLNYALNGIVRLLVRPDNVSVATAQLTASGTDVVGSTPYRVFGGELALVPGDVLRYELSGAALTSSQASGGESGPNLLPIVLAVIIGEIALVGGLYVLYRRRRGAAKTAPASGTTRLIDGLIQQIAELDEQYTAGQIDEASYQTQRAALKTRLAELMENK